MPIPATWTNPTGKRNLMTSFKKWLETQAPSEGITDFQYDWMSDVSNAKVFPNVGVSELPYFQPGGGAFGMNIFPKSAYPVEAPAKNGTFASALMQIEIKTDQGKRPDALQQLYKIRDRIKGAIQQAGIADDETLVVRVAGIEVKDYQDNVNGASTGIFARVPMGEASAIQEQYIEPSDSLPNIHTIKLLVRLDWFELN